MFVTLAENSAPATAHTRNIRTTTLPNGLLVLTERMPHLRSVSMGVWIDCGSRDESLATNGISHFIEHMVFKGTTTRSAPSTETAVCTITGSPTVHPAATSPSRSSLLSVVISSTDAYPLLV